MRKICLILTLLTACLNSNADDARDALIVQTVLKLENFDYGKSSEKVKGSIQRYLEKNLGSEVYFNLVDRFSIISQTDNLIDLSSNDTVNSRAVALLDKLGGVESIKKGLKLNGDKRTKFINSLGTVNSKNSVKELSNIVLSGKESDLISASTALTKSALGQEQLLKMIENEGLPERVRGDTLDLLSSSVNPEVRERVAKFINSNVKLNKLKNYDVQKLIKLRGDIVNGKKVYMKSCFTCHKAGDIGIDFGPALTEIGDKLAREAMYVSIIKPSQAISFGYEGFNIKTKNGLALIGYITSDSDKELVVRVPGGALIPTAKSDILEKTAIKGSLMPEGLVSAMTENELVDLVEYLMTLKKSS